MNKILSFLKESNRYKHLIGGLLVGLAALNPWCALYSSVVAASCLELKDKLKGGLLGLDRLDYDGRRRRYRCGCLAVFVTAVFASHVY